MTIEKFKAGELLTISEGYYSDYCVEGLFKVLVDFDAQEALPEWAKETGREFFSGVVKVDYLNKNINFLAWLNKKGYIEDVNYRELHIGDYGDTELREDKTNRSNTIAKC